MNTPTNYAYMAILLGALVLGGIGEYIHLLPSGSFYTLFFLIIGVLVPSPFPHTGSVTNSNADATIENTRATIDNTKQIQRDQSHG